MGEIILVASGKGGTGKSVFAVNMGAVLADKGYRVVLIDMDMGQGNLDLYLGLHNKVVYNVYDAAMGMCRMRQALIKDSRYDCLYLMAAPPHTNDGNVTPERLMAMYEDLKEKFDYIIIDAPAGVESNTMLAATQADRAVIVATPDYASVRGARYEAERSRNRRKILRYKQGQGADDGCRGRSVLWRDRNADTL